MMRPIRNRLVSAALAGAGFVLFSVAPLPAMADGSIVIRDFVLSHGISQHEPVGVTDAFRVNDGRAVAFARINNTGTPTRVRFVWRYGETTHANVPVNVGTSSGWRTWSSVNLRPGSWRVDLVDDQGAILAEKTFTVGPNSASPMAEKANGMQGVQGDAGNAADGAVLPEQVPASVEYPAR